MAYSIKGDISIKRALYLGEMTTAQRTAFTPTAAGAIVYDTTVPNMFIWNGTVWQELSTTKNNFAATVAPTVTDDSAAGYSVGSFWLDTTGKQLFIAEDVTAGAAVWERVDTPKSNLAATTAPTATDDSTAGYEAGSMWLDITNKKTYVCYDATATAAVWERIDGPQVVVSATTPNITHDNTQGYEEGTIWVETTFKRIYGAFSVATGAAEWKQLNNFKKTVSVSDPTATDDQLSGDYEVGSLWFNTTTNQVFICRDNSFASAVWERIDNIKMGTATADPTATDDVNSGYEVGSLWINTSTQQTFVCYDATNGAAVWERVDGAKNNVATVAPTATDDSASGYEAGSMWFDTVAMKAYVCYDATAGAAVWERVDQAKVNAAATVAPTVTDDSAAGYEVGSFWFDATNQKAYVCYDATAGAAVWERVDQAKNNASTTNPAVTDDSTAGYEVGSFWFNTTTGRTYVCYDATTGAAVWERIDGVKNNFAATIAPTATDDTSAGYEVGSLWVDVTNKKVYICQDATATAAVWERLDNLQNNLSATVPPTTLNDGTGGYEVGSMWLDTTTNNLYFCEDASTNAAVWERIDAPKNNVATANPAVTDDSAAGYEVGSFWFNTTTGRTYVCYDATAGAAVWERLDGVKNNFAATIAPTATDDTSAGYEVGSLWVDVTNKKVYICQDATATAAVWERLDNLKTNMTATLDPTVLDDGTAGYEVGSMWFNTVTKQLFFCEDASTNVAVWERLDTPRTNFGATADPTATDDSSAGYEVGSFWLNTSTNKAYMCMDSTATAAVWERIDAPKMNASATTAPTATDDSSAGYEVGSIWIDVTNDVYYACVDATATAAVWQPLTSNARVFITDTATAPAASGNPTVAEAQAAAGSRFNTIVHYNGTDTETNTPTHVWHVDANGNFTVVKNPASSVANITLTSSAATIAVALTESRTTATLTLAHDGGVIQAPTGGVPVGSILEFEIASAATHYASFDPAYKNYTGSVSGAEFIVYAGSVLRLRFEQVATGDWRMVSSDTNLIPSAAALGSVSFSGFTDNYFQPLGAYVYPVGGVSAANGVAGVANVSHLHGYGDTTTISTTTDADLTPDFSTNSAFKLVSTDGVNRVINAPTGFMTTDHVGNAQIIVENSNASTITVTFDNTAYVDLNGSAIGSFTIPANTGSGNGSRVFNFVTGSDNGTKQMILVGSAGSGGGLTPVAVTSAGTSTLQTREIFDDASTYTRTLPAATGSGKIIEFVTGDTILFPKTIAVQSGESLNGTTNGTFFVDLKNSTYKAIDIGTGKWSVALTSGGFDTTSLDYLTGVITSSINVNTLTGDVPFVVDKISGTGLSMTSGQISLKGGHRYEITFGYHVTGMSTGHYVYWGLYSVTNNIVLSNPTLYALAASNSYTENDGNVMSMVYEPTADEVVSIRKTGSAGTSHSLNINSTYLIVKELPVASYVPAGAVTPTPLGRISVANSTDQTPSTNPVPHFATWDTTHYASGLSLNPDGSVTLKANKTYRLHFSGQNPGLISGTGFFGFYDNTNSTSIGQNVELLNSNTGFVGSGKFSTEAIYTPTVDSDVGVQYVSGSMGDLGARSEFIVEELPASTVVNPDMITPTTLNRVSVAASLGSFTGVDAPITFDTVHHNTGGMVTSPSVITIPSTGTYRVSFDVDLDNIEATTGQRFVYVVKNDTAPANDAAAAAAAVMSSVAYVDSTDAGIRHLGSEAVLSLNANDTLILYFAAAAAGDAVQVASFVVEEVPDSTVVRSESHAFSTTEQLTNMTWIDGKPIYEITIDISGMADNTVLVTGATHMVKSTGTYTAGGSTTDIRPLPFEVFNVTSQYVFPTFNTVSGDIKLRTSETLAAGSYVTLQYTK